MQNNEAPRLAEFVRVRDWIASGQGGAAFRTYSAFEWFLRRHRAELIASGELIIRPGSAGTLCGPNLGARVLDILRREAVAAEGQQP